MKPITISIIIILCMLAFTAQSIAQQLASQAKPTTKQTKLTNNKSATPQFVAPISVQMLFGSQGFGADVKYGIKPKLSGRFGFGIIPVAANNLFSFSSLSVQSQASARFSNIHLLADYAPLKTQRIRLVGGAAYLIKGSALVTIAPSGTNQFGSQVITADQVGSVTARANWRGIAPYAGIALFNSFPNRMFNINLDLGTYYIASPGTSFTGTKLLADNSINAVQFNKNMQGYCWMPVVQLNFNFRIQ